MSSLHKVKCAVLENQMDRRKDAIPYHDKCRGGVIKAQVSAI